MRRWRTSGWCRLTPSATAGTGTTPRSGCVTPSALSACSRCGRRSARRSCWSASWRGTASRMRRRARRRRRGWTWTASWRRRRTRWTRRKPLVRAAAGAGGRGHARGGDVRAAIRWMCVSAGQRALVCAGHNPPPAHFTGHNPPPAHFTRCPCQGSARWRSACARRAAAPRAPCATSASARTPPSTCSTWMSTRVRAAGSGVCAAALLGAWDCARAARWLLDPPAPPPFASRSCRSLL